MSQWKKDDSAANSVLWAVAGYNKPANSTTQAAFYSNTTADAFITGMTIGQFGVDATEAGISGKVARGIVTVAGSGYTANAAVTLTATNGGSSATANATATSGKITAVNISAAGSGYTTAPTAAIAAPANTTFNASTAVTGGTGAGANNVITLSSAGSFAAGDLITYSVAAGNTAVGGLTSGTTYYVQFANSTVVALSTTSSGSRIALTPGASQTGHGLQGQTAEGYVTVSGGKAVAHAGWVVRKEGSGGRAGRVTYETLVAMGSMTGDGSDDPQFPDS